MYLLGAVATITWEIEATATPPALADLDLVIINPEGTEVYVNSAITAGNYTAPSEFVPGSATYAFSPDIEGLWRVRLVVGTVSSYTELSRVELQVLDSSSSTNPVASYIKTLVTSEAIKLPCVTATVANIVLSGLQTINTVTVVENDRVMVKDQTDATENGIYNASSGPWQRASDFNEDTEVTNGVVVIDNNIGVVYNITFTGALNIGTTEITFEPLASTTDLLASVVAEVGYAQEWARKAEDTFVSVAAGGGTDPDDYSALHFAAKTAADAIATAQDAIDTGNDAIATADDLTNTNATYQIFDDRYLGEHPSNPSTLNDGITALDASHDGIEFWDSTLKVRKTFNGGTLLWGLTSTSEATNAVDVALADSANEFYGSTVEIALKEANTGADFYCSADNPNSLDVYHNRGVIISSVNGELTIPANNVTLTAGHATLHRFDKICVNNESGAVIVEEGTPAASPAIPITPAGTTCIGRVYVPATTAVISDGLITDVRSMLTPIMDDDTFALASQRQAPSSEATKAYVDSRVYSKYHPILTPSFTNITITVAPGSWEAFVLPALAGLNAVAASIAFFKQATFSGADKVFHARGVGSSAATTDINTFVVASYDTAGVYAHNSFSKSEIILPITASESIVLAYTGTAAGSETISVAVTGYWTDATL
jgi:hypothetical protein